MISLQFGFILIHFLVFIVAVYTLAYDEAATTTPADGDKKAIAATFELATVLSDLENLQKEKEKATKRIAYLKSKLESNTEE